MPIAYTPDEMAALEGPFCSYVGLTRIATPVPVRLSTSKGDFPVDDSAFDPDGTIFLGAERLIDLPAFQRMWNGLAERVTITLNGVTDDMRTLAYDEADDVRGAVVRLGLLILGGDWEQIGPPRWLRRGRVDTIETENIAGDRERIKTIKFSLGSQMTGRQIPGAGTYTNQDQQSRPGSEDDRFCERTSLMSAQTVIKWPYFD